MFIIIPPDWKEQGVVPIAIRAVDKKGRIVFPGWIDAVKPIAGLLREMTRRITGDVQNVSHVTEKAVHSLSKNHGENLGPSPSRGVYITAKYAAKNLKWGGQRVRQGRDVALSDLVRDSLAETSDFVHEFENRDLVERLLAKAKERGFHDLILMINLYLGDAEDEIPSAFGVRPNSQERNSLSKRLNRGIRRLFEDL